MHRPWLFPVLALVVATAVFVPMVLVGDEAAPVIPAERHTARPKDRDPEAVTAALRRIDPCQLFDAAAVPVGPHACRLASGADGIDVRVGTFCDQFRRYPQAPIVLSGVKAYSRQAPDGSWSSQ